MEDMLLNGSEEQPKEVKRYNPADDLQFFNDKDFNNVWKDYMSVRVRKRASNSDRAIKQAIMNLVKLSKGDKRKAIAIVDQSVNSGWTGLFEPKDYVVPVAEKKATDTTVYDYSKDPECEKGTKKVDLTGMLNKTIKKV